MFSIAYSAVAGGYDIPLPPRFRDPAIRRVIFTDRPSPFLIGWERRPMPPQTAGMDPKTANRWCKMHPHLLFPEAAWSVYLDGNIRPIASPAPLIAEVAEAGAAIGLCRHPHRDDVAAEAQACTRMGKFDARDRARIDAQLRRYAEDGLPADHGLTENGVLVRDHRAPGLAEAMTLWWEEFLAGARRDQISLPWVLHRTGLPALRWDWSYRDPNPFLVIHPQHRRSSGALRDLVGLIEGVKDDGPAQAALNGALQGVRRLAGAERRQAKEGERQPT